ncbi:MAG: hypothetical protein D8M53_05735 [Armatimonadetes bacterium]|nr:hypothetical protein [Armatimonadota bacterium]
MVWPSVFDVGGGCGLPKDEREEMGLTGLPLPEWVGERHPLWGDLPELMGHLARSGNIRGEYRLVAITPVRSGGVIPPPTTALGASVEFSMLGFDVADEWLLSGLMNCGYINAERADLAKEFGSHLNKWHLFHDLNAAHAFQTITDQRVPEHAPFFVYALWAAAGRLPPEAAENWEADVDPGANRGGL